MRAVGRDDLKLVVVGGQKHLIDLYRRRVDALELSKRVTFVGMQHDVRPWLWAADVFVFPSAYETFSLVSFQAAAAGLPLIVTHLYGVEEFAKDGRNSVVVEKNLESLRGGIDRFLSLSRDQRTTMGARGAGGCPAVLHRAVYRCLAIVVRQRGGECATVRQIRLKSSDRLCRW